jgi:hypothetical protein
MHTTLIVLTVAALWLGAKATQYLQSRDYWTLYLRLSTLQHWFLIPVIITIWSLLCYDLVVQYPPSFTSEFRFPIAVFFILGSLVCLLSYVLPTYQSRGYMRLRWKAWTGPSRTGIPAGLVAYIGDRRDWEILDILARGAVVQHHVEMFSYLPSHPHRGLIVPDPTDLLKARVAADREGDHTWVPHSDVKEGLFQPVLADQPVSLLWGEHIGFNRRCSRGIISVPRCFLASWPKFASGLDGRSICLACGILARNKGLDPTSLICNLHSNTRFRIFEENSVFWPRPAKTLRSLYRREFEKVFSNLGLVYVTAATELALLFADAPIEVAEDWLLGELEHQDIKLNNLAYELDADADSLRRLYRGHYAVMLVSLSAHRIGVRVRPEMLVYDALCKNEGASPCAWETSEKIQERRQHELEALGPGVLHLIEAAV